MFQVHDSFILNVKRYSKSIRSFIVLATGLCIFGGIMYGLYWSLALNGDIVVEFLQQYFAPLVSKFFDDVNNLDNYLSMSMYLFIASGPCLFTHYLVQKTEEIIIDIHQKNLEAKKRADRILAERVREQEYTDISSYSICLSMDFSENINLSENFTNEINIYLTKLLKKELKKITTNFEIINSKAILIYSKDFYSYDKIYSTVLKQLANIKNLLSDKIKFLPTITTDAYTGEFTPEKTIRQHFDIAKCNLQGRSTATSTFRKKYMHICQNKYAGIPIGLYSTFEKENYKEYDLNLIHKNLNSTLSAISK